MISGYIRQDTTNQIQNGNVIDASVLDSEFEQVQTAFSASVGHTHSGSIGEGGRITEFGPVTNRLEHSGTVVGPVTNDTVSLGTDTVRFKDIFLSGNVSSGAGVQVSSGGPLAPSYSFTSDLDTGFYRVSPDQVGISTNGIARLVIDNTQITSPNDFIIGGRARVTQGTAALPALTFTSDPDTGLFSSAANRIGIATSGSNRFEVSDTSVDTGPPIRANLGSVSLPSYSFAGDTDTGLYSPGPNQVSIGVGGVLGFTLNSSGAVVNENLSVVKNLSVQSNSTFDGNADFNGTYVKVPGMIRGTSTNSQITFTGSGLNVGITAGGNQSVTVSSGGLSADNLTRNGSQVYSRDNIVGTVSQSAGVPTGAVVQSGSNANGSFTRWADGTMICNHSIVASAGATSTWTFPSTFAGTPEVSANPNSASARMGTTFAPSTTSCNFDIWDITGTRQANTARLSAVGKWF